MRKIRYVVASSLDGFLAGHLGEADWITHDPEVDFAALWAQSDTGLMGRRTYEAARQRLGEKAFSGITTIVSELTPDWVHALRARPGKDIWLFGGSLLFRSFLDAGLVDTVVPSVIPVLLGDGVPLLASPDTPAKLRLTRHNAYRSGRLSLVYEVLRQRCRRVALAYAAAHGCPRVPLVTLVFPPCRFSLHSPDPRRTTIPWAKAFVCPAVLAQCAGRNCSSTTPPATPHQPSSRQSYCAKSYGD